LSTKRKGMISTGIWIPEELLIKAKEMDSDFNLSHYVTQQLQKDFGSVEQQVDLFLKNLEDSV